MASENTIAVVVASPPSSTILVNRIAAVHASSADNGARRRHTSGETSRPALAITAAADGDRYNGVPGSRLASSTFDDPSDTGNRTPAITASSISGCDRVHTHIRRTRLTIAEP